MPAYLLDTSVYSQPLRRQPVVRALERWEVTGDAQCLVSVVSVAEVEFGLHLGGNQKRQQRYEALLQGRLDVVATDSAVWQEFAKRKARQQILGLPVSDLDLLIAACAIYHRLIVATLNAKDFSKIEGCAWEDWSS
jgi:tRNA(fMet)-specific endonuclease VapC